MTRPPDDNTPPAAPHAPGTHTDPQRDGSSEARPDLLRDLPRSYEDAVAEVGRWRSAYDAVLDELQAMLRESGLTVRQGLDTVRRLVADGHGRREVHRRLLDILGWESGTEEQALEALAAVVRVARGGRMGPYVYHQRNEARAECERLRRELSEAREAVGEGWFAGGATLAEAIRRKVHVFECERENRLADEHPPVPVEGPEGGAR